MFKFILKIFILVSLIWLGVNAYYVITAEKLDALYFLKLKEIVINGSKRPANYTYNLILNRKPYSMNSYIKWWDSYYLKIINEIEFDDEKEITVWLAEGGLVGAPDNYKLDGIFANDGDYYCFDEIKSPKCCVPKSNLFGVIYIKKDGNYELHRPDASIIEPYLVYDSKSGKIIDPYAKNLRVFKPNF
ncbi:DUF943 family protein [Taylorella asinigenitalis]|uniref:Uncharacterized protein n=1 Tax=Taylorella asinigenitalis (strain MCE3) TaxID=1008459 RepID=G4QCE1_TAYAM|nr:DUF943 family protein [Taylorella asinigenitalis]AEP36071.1 hypothetical protein TASI_0288 [Taylorella asinigenitalis MCE3]